MNDFTQIELSRPGKNNRLRPVVKNLEQELPKLAEDGVQIAVKYSGLNFADIMMRLGLYPDAPSAPFCPGYEISGIVEKVGTQVTHLRPGLEVFAGCYFGGQASHVQVPAWQVVPVAQNYDLKTAAALPVSALTCDTALIGLARVQASDSVMIDCGSGALGAMMISYLKHLGCREIIGLTSKQEKLATIEERGAKAMTIESWQHSQIKVDVIINSRGGKSLSRDRNHLKTLGRLVALGASHMVTKGGLSYFNVIKEFLAMKKISFIDLMHANQAVMGLNVLRLFEEPQVLKNSLVRVNELSQLNIYQPVVDKVFSYQEVVDAYDYLGQGHSRGKVLLRWDV